MPKSSIPPCLRLRPVLRLLLPGLLLPSAALLLTAHAAEPDKKPEVKAPAPSGEAGGTGAGSPSTAPGLDGRPAAFTPLFNGRDLTGWVNVNGAPETWTVRENGLLHCDGIPTGALRTERQYENFILELEWRHLKPGGNAGVFIWAGPLSAAGQPFLRAIEVQVLDHAYGKSDWFTTHGDVFPIHGSRMKPHGRHKGERSFPSEERSHGAPEWNHYRIVCQNGTLRLAVNGREVSGGSDCTWRKGYIALESEGGSVDWRNIRLLELPGGQASSSQTAPVAAPDQYVSLYDGRSLRGWRTPQSAAAGAAGRRDPGEGRPATGVETPSSAGISGWKPEDWELAGTGKGSPLELDRPLGDFTLQFDVRTGSGESASAPLPAAFAGIPLPGTIGKQWTRWQVTRRSTTLTCRQILPDGTPPSGEPSSGETKIIVPEGPAVFSLTPVVPVRLAGLYLENNTTH